MRIAFFGSAPFAEPTLCSLIEGEHDVRVVFTQPDRKAGRGGHVQQTCVKKRALMIGIPVEQPFTLKDGVATETLKRYDVELGVVVAYGHLIPKDMLRALPHGFINLHASLLPLYRGAAPVPHAILNGEHETGATVFRLNERWDAGDVLDRITVPIEDTDTSATVLEKMMHPGAELVRRVVGEIEAGWTHEIPQIDTEATRAPKLTKEMGLIDWYATPAQIDRMVRAFQPWPLAYTFFPRRKKKVRMSVLTVETAATPNKPRTPGAVLAASEKSGLIVQCGDGAVRLSTIQVEGKKPMPDAEFLRGARFEPGMMLG